MEHGGIKVKTLKQYGRYTGFVVSGHANAAPHGQDIVCAAVSAITQTTLLSIRTYVPCAFGVSEGLCYVNIQGGATRDAIMAAEVLMHSMVMGLDYIDKTHPGYLTFEEEIL